MRQTRRHQDQTAHKIPNEKGFSIPPGTTTPFYLNGIQIAGQNGFPRGGVQNDWKSAQPIWRTPFQRRRCLVPTDGFYEWVRPEVVPMIVRRGHTTGPAVSSAVP